MNTSPKFVMHTAYANSTFFTDAELRSAQAEWTWAAMRANDRRLRNAQVFCEAIATIYEQEFDRRQRSRRRKYAA